jgi:hypothetical protein
MGRVVVSTVTATVDVPIVSTPGGRVNRKTIIFFVFLSGRKTPEKGPDAA